MTKLNGGKFSPAAGFLAAIVAAFLITAANAYAMGGGGGMGGGGMGGGGNGHGQHMKAITGSGVGTGSLNCDGSGCNGTASGNFRGAGIGNGSFSATLNSGSPISNGSGSCYGTTGTITLTAANGATLTLDATGLLCAVGSSTTPATLTGSYLVEGGTSNFSKVSGTGNAALAIDSAGNAYLNLTGAMGAMNGGHMGGGM